MKMRQLTIDGRQEDIPERHERMKLFEAPKTMKGQMPMPEQPARRALRFGVFNRGVFHIADEPKDNYARSIVTLCGKGPEGMSTCWADLGVAQRIGRICKRCEARA
jgi:hypothetical protein